jgi:hypothetical protein
MNFSPRGRAPVQRCPRWQRLSLVIVTAFLGLLLWTTCARADGGPGQPLPAGTTAGTCQAWVAVNDPAFGMPPEGNAFGSEEGFELTTFGGQLYVGMEADNAYGARIWRTRPGVCVAMGQGDWEEVAAVGDDPFGNATRQDGIRQDDHIDSLEAFRGRLFASTANGGHTEQGTMVYASPTGAPNTWTPVISAGFGYTENTNFKDMQVFGDWLCGGTQNWTTGAQVWCTRDGGHWVQKNHGGFGAGGDDAAVVEVWSGHVYAGALYFGAQQPVAAQSDSWLDDHGMLYRTFDLDVAQPTWQRVYAGAAGSFRIDILGDLDGYLYIARRTVSETASAGMEILRSATGDPGTWVQVSPPGMDGNPDNDGTVVDGAAVYNGALYVAVHNSDRGVTVWRTTGTEQLDGYVDWSQVGGYGLDHGANVYAELAAFNGYLYAWTSNYITGQRVLRTACPIVAVAQPSRRSGAAERLDFPGLGAAITVTAGTVGEVVASLYPLANLFPPAGRLRVARTYTFATSSAGGFTADLALTYDPDEVATYHLVPDSLHLARWDGSGWAPCASGSVHDPDTLRITCRGVTDLSYWAVVGTRRRLFLPLVLLSG